MCVHACKPVLDLRMRTQACLYSLLPFPSPQNAFWELELGLTPDAGSWVPQDWSAPALFSCPHLHPPPPAPSASSPRPSRVDPETGQSLLFQSTTPMYLFGGHAVSIQEMFTKAPSSIFSC